MRRLFVGCFGGPAIGKDAVDGGTLEILAPEAMGGATRRNHEPILVQESQDAYALGVMAHQLVTRDTQPPFAMEVRSRLQAVPSCTSFDAASHVLGWLCLPWALTSVTLSPDVSLHIDTGFL